MTFSLLHNIVIGLLPCLIPPYALRLNRVFGTKRVGWLLFAVFTLLAVQQVVRFWHPLGLGTDPELILDVFYLLIPFLLLVGMVHIETLFKEHLRVEQEEKRMRAELETMVSERTVALDEANELMQREISLRKQGEAELRKSKEQYRFLFEQNPVPMWIFDLQSLKFLAYNAAALQQYGYSSAEFRNLGAIDLCVPDEAESFTEDCAVTSKGMHQRRLWRHRTRDGNIVEVEITAQDLTYGGRRARLVLAYEASNHLSQGV